MERKTAKLLDQLEDDDDPAPEIRERLAQRRREKEMTERRLREVESAPKAPAEPPTAECVRAALSKLAESLKDTPHLAREAIGELLNGSIVVREIESTGKQRKVLQGTLSLPASKAVRAITEWHREGNADDADHQAVEADETIVIDFREQTRTVD